MKKKQANFRLTEQEIGLLSDLGGGNSTEGLRLLIKGDSFKAIHRFNMVRDGETFGIYQFRGVKGLYSCGMGSKEDVMRCLAINFGDCKYYRVFDETGMLFISHVGKK